jgi:uncharacterized protein YydD (DUF2326 family)
MLRVRRLYSDPEAFDPVEFFDGVNLIVGDRSEDSRKTNGVGKSLMVEFLNFALLKELRHSRVRLIPKEVLSPETVVCLDLEIGEAKLTIRRGIGSADTPTIIVDGVATDMACVEDATKSLAGLLFEGADDADLPSFRAMLGPLMRDERSEFKSIVKCYDTDLRIPPDYTPHLYLLGIDVAPYKDAQRLFGEIQGARDAAARAKKEIESVSGKAFGEAKAELNELKGQVERIQRDLDKLGVSEGYGILRTEIIDIETQLSAARTKQGVLKSELAKVEVFRGDHYIDEDEVAALYNQFRDGLGDLIKKDIHEVTAFKRKIDDFQRTLMQDRRQSLVAELKVLDSEVAELGRRYTEKLSLLDQQGELKSLRVSIAAHQKKVEDQAKLAAVMTTYTSCESEKNSKLNDRSGAIETLRRSVQDAQDVIDSVEKTILDIHECVAGNRQSSFEVSVNRKKEILTFTLRIHDDGSHSIEREKVFLYDVAMLVNEETALRHPGFLVHDNIFDVDQDTLVRSLNYLGDNIGLLADRQYLLTISSDKLTMADLESLRLDISTYTRATYTKESKFLRAHYQELGT